MWQPTQRTIGDILKESINQYAIPPFQRAYKWGEEEAIDLIEDLRSYPETGEEFLFLGNFILEKPKDGKIYIIDGQQRLTTIMLLLVACRTHAIKLNLPELATKIQENLAFTNKYRAKGDIRNRLIASKSIRELFEHIAKSDWNGEFPTSINGKPIKRQVNKLKPIYNFFLGEVSKLKGEEALGDFLKAIDLSFVVQITIDKRTEALTIFERTNARGRDLDVADLLKNFLFAEEVKGVEELWEQIVENSGSTTLRMLKHFYVSKKGYILKPELYRELKKYGENVGAQKLSDELLAFSNFYVATRKADNSSTQQYFGEIKFDAISTMQDRLQEITASLQALREFKVVQFCPLAFAAVQCALKTGTDQRTAEAKALVRLFKAFEKHHFINNAICNRVGNEVEKLYADFCKSYADSTDFIKTTQKLIAELKHKDKLASEDEFISRFKELSYPDSLGLIAYIFDRFNSCGVDTEQGPKIFDPDPVLKRRNYNIEHFMPQKPEGAPKNKPTPEWVNNIGNLMPLYFKTNGKLQNKSPDEKVSLLKDEFSNEVQRLPFVREFVVKYGEKTSSWNEKHVQERAIELAKTAYNKIWKID